MEDFNELRKNLNSKRRDIDLQISALKRNLREIEEENRKIIKEHLRSFVGKCFVVVSGVEYPVPIKYVKIIDVPREYNTMTGVEFNEYQLPAFSFYVKNKDNILGNKNPLRPKTNEDLYGFDEDTVFLLDLTYNEKGVYHRYHRHNYVEITTEEFNQKLSEHLECLREAVTCIPDVDI